MKAIKRLFLKFFCNHQTATIVFHESDCSFSRRLDSLLRYDKDSPTLMRCERCGRIV